MPSAPPSRLPKIPIRCVSGITSPRSTTDGRCPRPLHGLQRRPVRSLSGLVRNGHAHRMPAASAVGHSAADLLIHCLSTEPPGRPLSKIPAKSPPTTTRRAYGRLPPAFARATIVRPLAKRPDPRRAGTASIRGEDCVCATISGGQLDETLANLASLVAAADGPAASTALAVRTTPGLLRSRRKTPIL